MVLPKRVRKLILLCSTRGSAGKVLSQSAALGAVVFGDELMVCEGVDGLLPVLAAVLAGVFAAAAAGAEAGAGAAGGGAGAALSARAGRQSSRRAARVMTFSFMGMASGC